MARTLRRARSNARAPPSCVESAKAADLLPAPPRSPDHRHGIARHLARFVLTPVKLADTSAVFRPSDLKPETGTAAPPRRCWRPAACAHVRQEAARHQGACLRTCICTFTPSCVWSAHASHCVSVNDGRLSLRGSRALLKCSRRTDIRLSAPESFLYASHEAQPMCGRRSQGVCRAGPSCARW